MGLLIREYKELETIQEKLASNVATSTEVEKFVNLINKSGNTEELLNYTQKIGFNSMDDFQQELGDKTKNENLIKGLAIVGSAILVAWLLTKK